MRRSYELEDWEWRLIVRCRQMIRDKIFGLVVIDLLLRAIVEKVNTHAERLDVSPEVALTVSGQV